VFIFACVFVFVFTMSLRETRSILKLLCQNGEFKPQTEFAIKLSFLAALLSEISPNSSKLTRSAPEL
jgi:hypothetical protein